MKSLFFIFLLVPLSLIAQTDSIPFKGAKQIIVKTDLPADEGYSIIINSLLDKGYFIDSRDEKFFTAKTQEKNVGKKSYQYFLNVRAKDNEVIVSGSFRLGIEIKFGGVTSPDDYSEITNRGMNGSAFKMVFNEMESFAKSLQKPISYR